MLLGTYYVQIVNIILSSLYLINIILAIQFLYRLAIGCLILKFRQAPSTHISAPNTLQPKTKDDNNN